MLDDLLDLRDGRKNTASNVISVVFGIIVLVLALFALIFSISFAQVSGGSMLSTIHEGEFIFCVRPDSLQRGDIVVAEIEEYDIVKRVVALPNERLAFVSTGDGKYPYGYDESVCLYLDTGNGFEPVDESDFIHNGRMSEKGFGINRLFADGTYKIYSGNIADLSDEYIITLGEREYFLMGDNRDNSTDSRYHGPFDKSKIKGKAIELIRNGTFFHSIMQFIYSPFSCNGK